MTFDAFIAEAAADCVNAWNPVSHCPACGGKGAEPGAPIRFDSLACEPIFEPCRACEGEGWVDG